MARKFKAYKADLELIIDIKDEDNPGKFIEKRIDCNKINTIDDVEKFSEFSKECGLEVEDNDIKAANECNIKQLNYLYDTDVAFWRDNCQVGQIKQYLNHCIKEILHLGKK